MTRSPISRPMDLFSLVAGMSLAAAGWLAATASAADGPAPQPCQSCQVKVELRGTIPLLSKIPYLSRLFPNHSEVVTAGATESVATESVATASAATASAATAGVTCPMMKSGGCPGCPGCPGLSGDGCAIGTIESSERVLTDLSHEGQDLSGGMSHAVANLELCEELATLRAELTTHETLAEAREEMFESYLELATEKARLECHLEFAAAREELREGMRELMAENAKLQSKLELAEKHHELELQTQRIHVENERLLARVAELEQRDRTTPVAERSAKKAKTAKNAVNTKNAQSAKRNKKGTTAR